MTDNVVQLFHEQAAIHREAGEPVIAGTFTELANGIAQLQQGYCPPEALERVIQIASRRVELAEKARLRQNQITHDFVKCVILVVVVSASFGAGWALRGAENLHALEWAGVAACSDTQGICWVPVTKQH